MVPVELVVTLLAFSFAMRQKFPASQYSNPVWGSSTMSPFLQIRESKGFKNLPSKSSGWENRQLTGSSVSLKVVKQLQRGISTTFSECFLLPDSLGNFIFKIHHLSESFAAGNISVRMKQSPLVWRIQTTLTLRSSLAFQHRC